MTLPLSNKDSLLIALMPRVAESGEKTATQNGYIEWKEAFKAVKYSRNAFYCSNALVIISGLGAYLFDKDDNIAQNLCLFSATLGLGLVTTTGYRLYNATVNIQKIWDFKLRHS